MVSKKQFPGYIQNGRFAFDILSDDRDYRISCPEMEQIPSWKAFPKREHFNELVLYILFVYDKNSPLLKKFPDLAKRRDMAAAESGLDKVEITRTVDKEKVKVNVAEEVKSMADDRATEMIVDFLMYQNDKLWAVICIHENLFAEYLTILASKLDHVNNDKDLVAGTNMKEKTREALNSVHADLETLYDKFYNGDSDMREKTEKSRKFSPENIGSRKLK